MLGGPTLGGGGAFLTGEVGVFMREAPEGGGANFSDKCFGDGLGDRSALITEALALFLIKTRSE